MPSLNVKTVAAEQVWKSPDGQRTIFKVALDTGNGNMEAKTYSGAIGNVGWSGEIITEEKQGRNGAETFVKQPPKEGGFTPYQGGSQKSTGGTGSSSSSKREFDNFTMYLSYAKDLVVALQQTEGFKQDVYEQLLTATIKGGKALYEHRPGGESEKVDLNKPDEIVEVPDEPISMDEVNKLFNVSD